MEIIFGILLFLWLISPIFLGAYFFKHSKLEKNREQLKNLKEILEISKQEAVNLYEQKADLQRDIQEIQQTYKTEIDFTNLLKKEKELTLEISKLEQEFSAVEEKDELSSFAFFDKIYDFETSVEYDQAMRANRDKQKEMIKAEEAVKGEYTLTFNGSVAQGKKIVKSNIKVITRAFNGECDACVSSVKWNNLETMQNRIGRSYEQLNKIAEKMNCQITPSFLKIKLEELKLMQEYLNQKQVEKEEQAELRARMREEEQTRREIEKAERDAQKEEDRYLSLLAKAEAEVKEKSGVQLEAMEAKIAHLREQLTEAQAKKERALSMAQQTRSGHVYVISNIGSFGENIYKVGMTRRIIPEDRVKELSDASVPFNFDIHAMIYSEDAVALEKAMHNHLWASRVNRINVRREFFATDWEDIEGAIKEVHGAEVHMTKVAKAFEYRQTIAMKETEEKENEKQVLMDA